LTKKAFDFWRCLSIKNPRFVDDPMFPTKRSEQFLGGCPPWCPRSKEAEDLGLEVPEVESCAGPNVDFSGSKSLGNVKIDLRGLEMFRVFTGNFKGNHSVSSNFSCIFVSVVPILEIGNRRTGAQRAIVLTRQVTVNMLSNSASRLLVARL